MGFQMVVPKDTFTYKTSLNKDLSNNTSNQIGILNENSGLSVTGNLNNGANFICDLNKSTSVTARTKFSSIKGD